MADPLFPDYLEVNSGHLGDTYYNGVSMLFSHIVLRWVYSKCSLALYMPTSGFWADRVKAR
jgi:hypothetical protein